MNTLFYMCYGEGGYREEIAFSLLTLQRFADIGATRLAVLTDTPDYFSWMGAEVVPIARAQFEAWWGPYRHTWRARMFAFQMLFDRWGDAIALVDGDTYFTQSPARLLRRIEPGCTVMQMPEGRLCDSGWPGNRRLGEALADIAPRCSSDRGNWRCGKTTVQWNAGVIGLHATDRALLDEVLHVNDGLLDRVSMTEALTFEQVAFSVVLANRTRLRQARDIVFHYNVSPDRMAFRSQIRSLLSASRHLDPAARAEFLYSRRLKPTLGARTRIWAKDMLNASGLLKRRDRCNCV